MNKDTVRARLEAIIRDFFGDPDIQLKNDTVASDVRGWDSLAHIELIVVVEKAFAVRFRAAEIQGIENFGAFVELICRHLKIT